MQEGIPDAPSVSSISRLLRGGRPGDDLKKDYTIDGILGGGKCLSKCQIINISSICNLYTIYPKSPLLNQ